MGHGATTSESECPSPSPSRHFFRRTTQNLRKVYKSVAQKRRSNSRIQWKNPDALILFDPCLSVVSVEFPRSLLLDLLQDDVGQGGAGLMDWGFGCHGKSPKKWPGDGSSYLWIYHLYDWGKKHLQLYHVIPYIPPIVGRFARQLQYWEESSDGFTPACPSHEFLGQETMNHGRKNCITCPKKGSTGKVSNSADSSSIPASHCNGDRLCRRLAWKKQGHCLKAEGTL